MTQAGSLAKASHLLNISQAAISKSIKTLESELGVELTIPSGRGIAITDKGRKLVTESLPLLEKFAALKNKLIESTPGQPQVRLGSFEVFTTYFLKDLISGTLEGYSLDVFECVPGEMERALRNGVIDLGLTYLPIPDSELDFLKVTKIEMGLFAKKGTHVRLSNKNDLQNLKFIAPNIKVEGTPSRIQGLDGWPDHELPRNIVHRVGMLQAALLLCSAGQGVGFFPKFVADRYNASTVAPKKLSEIPIPKVLKIKRFQDVFLLKRKTDKEGLLAKKVARQLRKLALNS